MFELLLSHLRFNPAIGSISKLFDFTMAVTTLLRSPQAFAGGCRRSRQLFTEVDRLPCD